MVLDEIWRIPLHSKAENFCIDAFVPRLAWLAQPTVISHRAVMRNVRAAQLQHEDCDAGPSSPKDATILGQMS